MATTQNDDDTIRRELENLRIDFERLSLVDAGGSLATLRVLDLSSNPIPKPSTRFPSTPTSTASSGKSGLLNCSGTGVSTWPTPCQTIVDFADASPLYYRGSGNPLLNSNGQTQFISSGVSSFHTLGLSGRHAPNCLHAIERANQWVLSRMEAIGRLIYPTGATFRSYSWPDIVVDVANKAGVPISQPCWMIELGHVMLDNDEDGNGVLVPTSERQVIAMSIEMWKDRNDPLMRNFQPFNQITEADELFYGTEPECYFWEREINVFLRDSELAIGWLIENLSRDPTESKVASASSAKEITEGKVTKMASEPKLSANARMMLHLQKHPEAKDFSCRQWCVALGVRSTSTIFATATWKNLSFVRGMNRQELEERQSNKYEPNSNEPKTGKNIKPRKSQ